MPKRDISPGGIICAVAFAFVALVGQSLTTERNCDHYNWAWLAIYVLAVLTLSGAVVNFDPKRWLG